MSEQNSVYSVWAFITVVFGVIFGLSSFVTKTNLVEFTEGLMYLGLSFVTISALLSIVGFIKKEKGFLIYASFFSFILYVIYFVFLF